MTQERAEINAIVTTISVLLAPLWVRWCIKPRGHWRGFRHLRANAINPTAAARTNNKGEINRAAVTQSCRPQHRHCSDASDAVDRLLSLAVSATFSQLGVSSYEKRQTTFLDDSRCANLEVTGSEENPRWQNREDLKRTEGATRQKAFSLGVSLDARV